LYFVFKTGYTLTSQKNYILDAPTAAKKLRRMAYEILENNTDTPGIVLAGVRESGHVIARNIKRLLGEINPLPVELITITLDKKWPTVVALSEQSNFDDKIIIVVDDVVNSGKTLLYALKPFLEFHPAKIQTLVLVERSHKAFPVKPDYVGLSIATTPEEHIYVEVEDGQVTGAYLE
jgi:pyrimidine operon attenuation protein/uracil phosphoribosyltransferase